MSYLLFEEVSNLLKPSMTITTYRKICRFSYNLQSRIAGKEGFGTAGIKKERRDSGLQGFLIGEI